MRFLFLTLFLFLLGNNKTDATYEEKKLRNYLFAPGRYNKNVRPISNYSQPIEIQQGIAVQTLESFDQMNEAISLNMWIRSNWVDEYLSWNNVSDPSLRSLDFLSVSPDEIWTPDTELLNAATKPEIYYLQGGINLYSDGSILYSKPGIYTSSCSLDLKDFPFDTQNCTILIASWVYHDNLLSLIPNKDENKQIDVLSTFSHSEWKVDDVEVRHLKETRDCCPDNEYDLLSYSFILKRYTHYYRISMGMTITLVIVSFVIMLMSPSNVSRTSTAVFIPLTILALQLTIANKIPVVGYYTLMDKFFLCCFITSMICSIESGLIYAIITTKSPRFYDLIDRIFNLEYAHKKNDDMLEMKSEKEVIQEEEESESVREFKMVEKALEEVANEDNIKMNMNISTHNSSVSLDSGLNNQKSNINVNIHTDIDKNTDLDTDLDTERNTENIESNLNLDDTYLRKNNIKKVIDYDDKRLYLTAKQQFIDDLVTSKLNQIDTVIRVILPIVFVSYIIYIFSLDSNT